MQSLTFIASAVLLVAVQCSGRALNPTGATADAPSTRGLRGFLIMAPLPSSSSAASLFIPLDFDSLVPATETPLEMKKRGMMDFVPNAETIAAFNEMNKKTADSWVPKATPPPAIPSNMGLDAAKADPVGLSSSMGFIPDAAAIAAFNDLTKSLNKATLEAWVAKATPSVSAAVPSAAPAIAAAPRPFGEAPLSALQARQFFM